MTTQLKEAADPSEFTQHTLTEAQILAMPEFIEVKNTLEHRLLKPSESVEICLPRNQWSIEAIQTLLGCLIPFTKGCGYSFKTEADDEAEYLSFTNTRDNDSELNPLNLPSQELKTFAMQGFEEYSDSEVEEDFREYKQMLSELGQVRDGEGKAFVEKTKTLMESILAVAYRRGLPWAVIEMHKTAALGQA